jgi:hypothetical protein
MSSQSLTRLTVAPPTGMPPRAPTSTSSLLGALGGSQTHLQHTPSLRDFHALLNGTPGSRGQLSNTPSGTSKLPALQNAPDRLAAGTSPVLLLVGRHKRLLMRAPVFAPVEMPAPTQALANTVNGPTDASLGSASIVSRANTAPPTVFNDLGFTPGSAANASAVSLELLPPAAVVAGRPSTDASGLLGVRGTTMPSPQAFIGSPAPPQTQSPGAGGGAAPGTEPMPTLAYTMRPSVSPSMGTAAAATSAIGPTPRPGYRAVLVSEGTGMTEVPVDALTLLLGDRQFKGTFSVRLPGVTVIGHPIVFNREAEAQLTATTTRPLNETVQTIPPLGLTSPLNSTTNSRFATRGGDAGATVTFGQTFGSVVLSATAGTYHPVERTFGTSQRASCAFLLAVVPDACNAPRAGVAQALAAFAMTLQHAEHCDSYLTNQLAIINRVMSKNSDHMEWSALLKGKSGARISHEIEAMSQVLLHYVMTGGSFAKLPQALATLRIAGAIALPVFETVERLEIQRRNTKAPATVISGDCSGRPTRRIGARRGLPPEPSWPLVPPIFVTVDTAVLEAALENQRTAGSAAPSPVNPKSGMICVPPGPTNPAGLDHLSAQYHQGDDTPTPTAFPHSRSSNRAAISPGHARPLADTVRRAFTAMDVILSVAVGASPTQEASDKTVRVHTHHVSVRLTDIISCETVLDMLRRLAALQSEALKSLYLASVHVTPTGPSPATSLRHVNQLPSAANSTALGASASVMKSFSIGASRMASPIAPMAGAFPPPTSVASFPLGLDRIFTTEQLAATRLSVSHITREVHEALLFTLTQRSQELLRLLLGMAAHPPHQTACTSDLVSVNVTAPQHSPESSTADAACASAATRSPFSTLSPAEEGNGFNVTDRGDGTSNATSTTVHAPPLSINTHVPTVLRLVAGTEEAARAIVSVLLDTEALVPQSTTCITFVSRPVPAAHKENSTPGAADDFRRSLPPPPVAAGAKAPCPYGAPAACGCGDEPWEGGSARACLRWDQAMTRILSPASDEEQSKESTLIGFTKGGPWRGGTRGWPYIAVDSDIPASMSTAAAMQRSASYAGASGMTRVPSTLGATAVGGISSSHTLFSSKSLSDLYAMAENSTRLQSGLDGWHGIDPPLCVSSDNEDALGDTLQGGAIADTVNNKMKRLLTKTEESILSPLLLNWWGDDGSTARAVIAQAALAEGSTDDEALAQAMSAVLLVLAQRIVAPHITEGADSDDPAYYPIRGHGFVTLVDAIGCVAEFLEANTERGAEPTMDEAACILHRLLQLFPTCLRVVQRPRQPHRCMS